MKSCYLSLCGSMMNWRLINGVLQQSPVTLRLKTSASDPKRLCFVPMTHNDMQRELLKSNTQTTKYLISMSTKAQVWDRVGN